MSGIEIDGVNFDVVSSAVTDLANKYNLDVYVYQHMDARQEVCLEIPMCLTASSKIGHYHDIWMELDFKSKTLVVNACYDSGPKYRRRFLFLEKGVSKALIYFEQLICHILINPLPIRLSEVRTLVQSAVSDLGGKYEEHIHPASTSVNGFFLYDDWNLLIGMHLSFKSGMWWIDVGAYPCDDVGDSGDKISAKYENKQFDYTLEGVEQAIEHMREMVTGINELKRQLDLTD
jgi:hypothetical protein